jgi:hypothetical protein
MPSTFTTAKNLEKVPRGGDLGTWDTPENSNWDVVDACLGQSVTIGLNNANVTLSSPQYQASTIIFNSTLTGSVNITFPSTFTGPYIIQNLCTGTSAFTVTLLTTIAGGQAIACPPGDSFNAINDGTNIKFHNIGRVGTYWDYAGSSVPNWVSGCTVAPWLNCDGTTFSSATFPQLTVVLGSTTLPDSRGRSRFALNQGTSRIQSSVVGLDGTVLAAGGGSQLLQNHTHVSTDAGHQHGIPTVNAVSNSVAGSASYFMQGGIGSAVGANNFFANGGNVNTGFASISVSNSTWGGTSGNVPPAYIGGLTLIRSA